MGSVRVSSIAEHDEALVSYQDDYSAREAAIIFALQTNRKNNIVTHKICLNNCKLTNVKLHLNSELFPYDNLNLDFDKRRTAILYDIFIHFRTSYYQISKESSETLFKTDSFRNLFPLVIIDCSRQNESVKNGTVDVRLEFNLNSKKMYQ